MVEGSNGGAAAAEDAMVVVVEIELVERKDRYERRGFGENRGILNLKFVSVWVVWVWDLKRQGRKERTQRREGGAPTWIQKSNVLNERESFTSAFNLSI